MDAQDPLVVAGRAFGSRLLVGTGKFGSFEVMRGTYDGLGCARTSPLVPPRSTP